MNFGRIKCLVRAVRWQIKRPFWKTRFAVRLRNAGHAFRNMTLDGWLLCSDCGERQFVGKPKGYFAIDKHLS